MRLLSTVVVSVATASLFAMPLACSSSPDPAVAATSDAGSPEGSVPLDAGPQMDAGPPASALALTVTTAPAPLALGKSVHLIVHVARGAADTGDVVLTIAGLPTGVTASPTTIAAGTSDGDVTLTASMAAKVGPATLTVTGTAPSGSANATAKLTVRGLSGTLDTGLSATGVFFATTATEAVGSIVVQPDGKIVLGGHSALQAWVARYDDAMAVDTSFGTAGSTTVDFATTYREDFYGLFVDTTGRIVAAGTSNTNGTQGMALAARFTAAGALDATYATAGKTKLSYVGGTGSAVPRSLLQADGKLTMLGSVTTAGYGQWAFARLGSDGALDATFGTGGITTIPTSEISGSPGCGGFQSDGKLVAGGVSFGTAGPIVPVWRIERLASGVPDNGYGTSGGISVTQAAVSGIFGCTVDKATDNFVAAGVILENSHYEFALERFTSAGVPDPTFNGGAVSPIIIADSDGTAPIGVTDVFLENDGKILVVGSAPSGFFTIARWNANGTPDTTFGTAGVFTTSATVTSQGQIIATTYDALQNRVVFAGTGVVGANTGIFVARVWL